MKYCSFYSTLHIHFPRFIMQYLTFLIFQDTSTLRRYFLKTHSYMCRSLSNPFVELYLVIWKDVSTGIFFLSILEISKWLLNRFIFQRRCSTILFFKKFLLKFTVINRRKRILSVSYNLLQNIPQIIWNPIITIKFEIIRIPIVFIFTECLLHCIFIKTTYKL